MSFGPKSVTYLGHVFSAEGVSVGTERIQAIKNLKTPTSIKVAVNTIVPRSPFFAFCTPKYRLL